MARSSLRVVIDIECNGLKPTQIWLIVCKDIDTGLYHIFRKPTQDEENCRLFVEFCKGVDLWIGHNIVGYDWPVLAYLLGVSVPAPAGCMDTFILSKLIDFPRPGHSIEDYGIEFNLPKGDFSDWSKYSKEMEEYCVRDVDICHKIYLKYLKYISNPLHQSSILLEHKFQLIVNELKQNGFSFDTSKAAGLLAKVRGELDVLDKSIEEAFHPRLRAIREITPKYTHHGTLHRGDFRWVIGGDLSGFNGGPFTRCEWITFNPASHKQIVDTLHDAGWSPTDKTKTHIEVERSLKRTSDISEEAVKALQDKLQGLRKYGWKINETNLLTLPARAPKAARILAKRILLESRRRTLVEWLGLVHPDTGRIHGDFIGIGAWTHRMAHQKPNTANIPNNVNGVGKPVLYGKEMRSLWQAPPGRLLVGVDAEGIQLRIFAHYIDDPEFTDSLVNGRKEDESDPHNLNKRILGSVCKNRESAKRFIFALLLGAGIGKLEEILECSRVEAERALGRLMERYQGFTKLKKEVIPADAKRGWFTGLDGRRVRIPGETVGERKHLCMSGYLQNGEAIVLKEATCRWLPRLRLKYPDTKIVNFVHDEWQTEVVGERSIALDIAKTQAQALTETGVYLKLKCPLSGSYGIEGKYTIGTNWYQTH